MSINVLKNCYNSMKNKLKSLKVKEKLFQNNLKNKFQKLHKLLINLINKNSMQKKQIQKWN